MAVLINYFKIAIQQLNSLFEMIWNTYYKMTSILIGPRRAQIQTSGKSLSRSDLNNNEVEQPVQTTILALPTAEMVKVCSSELEREATKIVGMIQDDLDWHDMMSELLTDEELNSAFDVPEMLKKEPIVIPPPRPPKPSVPVTRPEAVKAKVKPAVQCKQKAAVIPQEAKKTKVKPSAQPKMKVPAIPHDTKKPKAKTPTHPKESPVPPVVNKSHPDHTKKQSKVQQLNKIKKPYVCKNPDALQTRPRWR